MMMVPASADTRMGEQLVITLRRQCFGNIRDIKEGQKN